jgi:protein-S-isoprenylcysteine O-methyltransferase Ste14
MLTNIPARFVASIILSVYLVVGTLLEEEKLSRNMDRYRRYQQQVHALSPGSG